MTVEQLITFLKKCDPTFLVSYLHEGRDEYVEFVELRNQARSVLLLNEKPNWEEVEEEDAVAIEVIHEEDGFASVAWTDL
jgi:predicted Zn-dependent protease